MKLNAGSTVGFNLKFRVDCFVTTAAACARGSIWEQTFPGGPYEIAQQLSASDADVTSLAVLPNYQTGVPRTVLVSAHADGIARVWDVAAGQLLATLAAHSEPLFSMTVMQVRVWSGR